MAGLFNGPAISLFTLTIHNLFVISLIVAYYLNILWQLAAIPVIAMYVKNQSKASIANLRCSSFQTLFK
jgi:hypothetical protein